MEFHVLGPLQASDGEQDIPLGGRKQKTVLAVLVANAPHTVSTDRLIDALWGNEPPDAARKSIQAYVARLRGAFGGDVLVSSRPGGYLLHIAPEQVDAGTFEQLVAKARTLVDTEPGVASETLQTAEALWRGRPYGELADEPALAIEVARLGELRIAATELRITADLANGRAEHLVPELEALIAQYPLREGLRAHHMLALYRTGRQAEALRSYQRVRAILAEELGIQPGSELQTLERRILLQDPDLLVVAEQEEVPTIAPNPYQGLRPFTEANTDQFFGRSELVTEILQRIDANKLVTLVGPSGCGKSSILRAGVVPAAGDGRGHVAVMRPGARPFEAMEEALLDCTGRSPGLLLEGMSGGDLAIVQSVRDLTDDKDMSLLLVIDQFEELYTVADEPACERFVDNLVAALHDPDLPMTMVLGLRADFYDRPLRHSGFGPFVADSLLTVMPLGPEGLEAAALEPARQAGVRLEPALLTTVVAEAANQPGSLPLFEYTLTEMFDRRQSSELTMDDYVAVGRLQAALSKRAEALFERLKGDQRSAARELFLRLVTLGEGTEDSRRRVGLSEIDSLPIDTATMNTALDTFGRHRLLTFDRDVATGEPTIEVAHEALLREWPRLQRWIDEARDDLRRHRQLVAETAAWRESDRDPDYLLTGSKLSVFDEWSRGSNVALTADEAAFLDTSRHVADERRRLETARRARETALEHRALIRLRAMVAVLAAGIIAAGALTWFALDRSADARRQAELADQQRVTAELNAARVRAGELTASSVAHLGDDPQLSLLLVLHAVGIFDGLQEVVPEETVAAIHWAIQANDVQYPLDAANPATLAGPGGPRGIYPMLFPDLIALARSGVTRALDAGECAAFFPSGCPPLAEAFSPELEALDPVPLAGPPPLSGTVVRVLGAVEGFGLLAEFDAFTEQTGIQVIFTDPTNFEGLLNQGKGPTLADLVLLPQPGLIPSGIKGGLLSIDYVDRTAAGETFSPYLVSLGTVASDGIWPSTTGKLYGIPYNLSVKSLIWYPVPEFKEAGYQIPSTWDDLVALTDQMMEDGFTPWCAGEFGWEATGWPATDWIEDILLHAAGPETYDRWVSHDVPFTDLVVRDAFIRYGDLILRDGATLLTRPEILATPMQITQWPMFDDPPSCWLYHQGVFAAGTLPFGVEAETDTLAFTTPSIDSKYASAMLGSGGYATVAHDRPEVRALLRHMTDPTFASIYVSLDSGYLSPNRQFDVNAYPEDLRRTIARSVQAALASDQFRFDGSDLMPFEVGTGAFWHSMVDFISEGPDNLDEVLESIDDAWP